MLDSFVVREWINMSNNWKQDLQSAAEKTVGYSPDRQDKIKSNSDRRLERAIRFKLQQERTALRQEARHRIWSRP